MGYGLLLDPVASKPHKRQVLVPLKSLPTRDKHLISHGLGEKGGEPFHPENSCYRG